MVKGTCSIEDCERPAYTRGWCSAHYSRWHKHGDVNYVGPFTPYKDAGVTKNGGPCSIDGCPSDASVRGWCWRHYDRYRRHGDPNKAGPRGDVALRLADPVERFWTRVERTTGCWYWIGIKSPRGGYGKINMGPGKTTLAHRISYEWLVGPIPEGMVLDHLCMTTECVRPDHLQPVTVAENSRRAGASRSRTHCARGHEMTGSNVALKSGGGRTCRECSNASQNERRRRSSLDDKSQRWLEAHRKFETYDLPAALAALAEARGVIAGTTG